MSQENNMFELLRVKSILAILDGDEVFGEIKPTMTLVVVSGLIDKRFKIEIDAIVNFSKAE